MDTLDCAARSFESFSESWIFSAAWAFSTLVRASITASSSSAMRFLSDSSLSRTRTSPFLTVVPSGMISTIAVRDSTRLRISTRFFASNSPLASVVMLNERIWALPSSTVETRSADSPEPATAMKPSPARATATTASSTDHSPRPARLVRASVVRSVIFVAPACRPGSGAGPMG